MMRSALAVAKRCESDEMRARIKGNHEMATHPNLPLCPYFKSESFQVRRITGRGCKVNAAQLELTFFLQFIITYNKYQYE